MNPSSLKLRRTGKVFLLGALVCAGQMYGMEPMEHKNEPVKFGQEWKTLPDEVKRLILVALSESGNNLDEAIKNIVKASKINKELNSMINLNDLKGFTKIVHMLADRFNQYPIAIATKYFKKSAVASRYLSLATKLKSAIAKGEVETAKEAIAEGVDVNNIPGLLHVAIYFAINKGHGTEIIQLLLDNGINPYAHDMTIRLIPLKYLDRFQNAWQYIPVKRMLEDAMQRYQEK